MPTLKTLLVGITLETSLGFSLNEKVDSNGVQWANAFVKSKEEGNKLISIGATVETLQKLQAEPQLADLMLTELVPVIANNDKKTEYLRCQLAITAPKDFNFTV